MCIYAQMSKYNLVCPSVLIVQIWFQSGPVCTGQPVRRFFLLPALPDINAHGAESLARELTQNSLYHTLHCDHLARRGSSSLLGRSASTVAQGFFHKSQTWLPITHIHCEHPRSSNSQPKPRDDSKDRREEGQFLTTQFKIHSVQVAEGVKTELRLGSQHGKKATSPFRPLFWVFKKRSPILRNRSPPDQTWNCQQHSKDALILTKHWNTILYLLICITMELFASGKWWKPASISELCWYLQYVQANIHNSDMQPKKNKTEL